MTTATNIQATTDEAALRMANSNMKEAVRMDYF